MRETLSKSIKEKRDPEKCRPGWWISFVSRKNQCYEFFKSVYTVDIILFMILTEFFMEILYEQEGKVSFEENNMKMGFSFLNGKTE